MIEYIKQKPVAYAKAIDKSNPDGRPLISLLTDKTVNYVPCGLFNKSNSCDKPFTHDEKEDEVKIHACSLCYFALCGMINAHRQSKCPLLSYM